MLPTEAARITIFLATGIPPGPTQPGSPVDRRTSAGHPLRLAHWIRTMPKITTHYVSGPADVVVYAAADAAGLPELVTSAFDGQGTFWRWDVTPPERHSIVNVVLLMVWMAPGRVAIRVGVPVTDQRAPAQRFNLLDQTESSTPAAVDPTWLTATLRAALQTAKGDGRA